MHAWIIHPLTDHRIRKAIGAAAIAATLVVGVAPADAMHARHNHAAHHAR